MIEHADSCMINKACPRCDIGLAGPNIKCICRTPDYKCDCGADPGSGVPGSIETRQRYVSITAESPAGMHSAVTYREIGETQEHYIARVVEKVTRMVRDLG